ncbi:MAG: winged helix-turn-helix domain-containing protein [Bacteroidales bacterium]|nr:winged helix-turn-helix domain-containing protein [Bacteroidales bacterium]
MSGKCKKLSQNVTRIVDNIIHDPFKKLEANPSEPKHILSVRGVGYRFNSGNE